MPSRRCFFASLPNAGECDGPLVRAHLITQQEITRRVRSMMREKGFVPDSRETGTAVVAACADIRSWVWGCGGQGYGNMGHHGQFLPDGRWPVPRSRLPAALEEFAEELGLTWWLERTYGVKRDGTWFRGDREDHHTSTVDGAAGAEEDSRRGPLYPAVPERERPDWNDAA